MCRYSLNGPYKSHLACFACRKSFKQPPISDWLAARGSGFVYAELSRIASHKPSLERREKELGVSLNDLLAEYENAAHQCPECNQLMIDMGYDFKPPRQIDKKAWRIFFGLYRVGHAFHTCGCGGPGFIPKTKTDYRQYLQNRRTSFTDELNQVQQSTKLSPDDKHETGDYWLNRISLVDAELKKLT